MEKIDITDKLFIYRDESGIDRLMYIVDPSKEQYEQVLNMREVESNVNKAIQKHIEFIDMNNNESLDKAKLFIFLLKVRLYEEYILRNLLGNMLFDEYDQLTENNKLALILMEYLLNKEPLSEKDKSIIKNIDIFNKLYTLFENITFGMPKRYIISTYYKFLDTLKAENISIQES